MKGLAISADGSLTLPLDAITQTIVVYGAKGKGKTNFGTVLMEELARNRLKFSALDPYGVMWGARYGRTKSESGLEILILGGIHGDLPILPTSGAVVADLVSDEAISTVVDISRHATGKMWSKGEKIRFVADYATRLFERQGEHQRPLMQIIDEAGRYCPQTFPHGAVDLARCVGAIEELVEVGRNVGIGVTLITQRSARMNKSVSELAEAMVAFCTLGPNSVEAITDWCGEHIERSRWKELVASLRKLPRGTAMVVSPSWLDLEGKVVPIRARETFDSSATPKAGAARVKPGRAAMPDLGKYRERMSAVEREVLSVNPAELRKQLAAKDARISLLEKHVGQANSSSAARVVQGPPVVVSVPAFDADKLGRLHAAFRDDIEELLRNTDRAFGAYADHVEQKTKEAKAAIAKASTFDAKKATLHVNGKSIEVFGVERPKMSKKALRQSLGTYEPSEHDVPSEGMPSADRKILTSLAQYPQGRSRKQILILAGYRPSGSVDQAFARLKRNGHIVGSTARFNITHAGEAYLGPFEPLPTGPELFSHWLHELSTVEAKFLKTLNERGMLSRADLLEATGYKPSGSCDQAIAKLKRLDLIVGGSNGMHINGEVFS